MKRLRRRKCPCCSDLFKPDYRNLRHQQYCSKEACRRVSKAKSQRRWLSKEENANYFKGPDQVTRVQAWRRSHPGYSRNQRSSVISALQDHSLPQPIDNAQETASLKSPVVQESLFAEPAILVGLIANLSGLALQEAMPNAA